MHQEHTIDYLELVKVYYNPHESELLEMNLIEKNNGKIEHMDIENNFGYNVDDM